jgi:hypothetical protein
LLGPWARFIVRAQLLPPLACFSWCLQFSAAASVSFAAADHSCSLLEFPDQDLVFPLLWSPPAVEAAPFVLSVCKAWWSFDVLACQGFDHVVCSAEL